MAEKEGFEPSTAFRRCLIRNRPSRPYRGSHAECPFGQRGQRQLSSALHEEAGAWKSESEHSSTRARSGLTRSGANARRLDSSLS